MYFEWLYYWKHVKKHASLPAPAAAVGKNVSYAKIANLKTDNLVPENHFTAF